MAGSRSGLAGGLLALLVVLMGVGGCSSDSGSGIGMSHTDVAAQPDNASPDPGLPGAIPTVQPDAQASTTAVPVAPVAAGPAPAVVQAAAVGGDSGDYRIAPRDVIQVTVFQVPDLNRTVQVDNTGFITLPLINGVHVGGLTMRQAQDEITSRLAKSYLQSPQVTLSLVKSGQRVTINGAVKNPQVLTVDGELTLSQAIALAGGTNDVANSDRIHVARVVSGHVSDDVYDLGKIQSGQATDPSLRGGDIVVVEDSQAKVAFKNVKDLLPFAVLGGVLSDAHVKRNIRPLYVRADGITVYRYQYKWTDLVYVGVIAQQVERIRPDAVVHGGDGLLRVNYSRLGMEMETCKVWMAMRGPAQQSLDCFAGPGAGDRNSLGRN